MDKKAFKVKTKKLAVSIIKQIDKLPRSLASDVIARQLLRSGTSIGANYRAACLAKSKTEVLNKLKKVQEESDETVYWLELLTESGLTTQYQVADIYKETNEIFDATIASIKTLRNRAA